MDFTLLAIGLAAAGYFIGEGLKNFQNDKAKDPLENIFGFNKQELIKESKVHSFLGITKRDAETLIQDYPSIPHITLNGKVYYPKHQLQEWMKEIGK
ncbi:DNA-binding protein [Alkalicoccus halolimnae]|uniref:DNA-binding protein n=1 Tax=Alkalicoccus halolimnae TaxID=1667239 RepID=A0A5C7FHH4_9BACI|nr:DNA-binding protein [Alkalicoccus halolimnae]TXF83258.1 DNA-binding protein [Alkalicoccus halolimnae]